MKLARLQEELVIAGLPVVGCALREEQTETDGPATWHERAEGWVRVDWSATPTGPQETQAGVVVAAHDGSAAADAPGIREEAKSAYDRTDASGRRDRAIVLTSMDENNIMRELWMDFKAAVAGATTLAALKTAVAALDNTPQRTPAQARTALRNAIDEDA